MITLSNACDKCHAPNTYMRSGLTRMGKVMERFCYNCGWCRPVAVWESEEPSRPITTSQAQEIAEHMMANASLKRDKGYNVARVAGSTHKPYKSYKRRGANKVREADFELEVDPDTI